MVILQLLAIGEKVMENAKEQVVKNAFKKLWTKVKPFLPAITLVSAIIVAVIVLTYFYFACSFGFIPSDRIVDENAIKKSDWLMFWGSILAVICTLSLALVSYKQNKDLQKINDDREKKDTFFAKMRFAAEFYSQVAFESLFIKINKDKTSTISMDLIDTGKIPPAFINIEKFIIKASEEIAKRVKIKTDSVEGCLVHQTRVNIKERDIKGNNDSNVKRNMIRFTFEVDQTLKFQELYKVVYDYTELNNGSRFFNKSYINLVFVYVIENSLKVRTAVKTVMNLKASIENISVEEYPDAYRFYIEDTSVESIEYTFIGEIQ